MTYEEALNQGIKMTDEYARNDLERYLLRKEEPIPKSVALGMKALEKQIPKKPIMEKSNNICFDEFCCPSCKKRIISRLDGEWIAGKTQKYCDECGQAIDWSEDNG